MKETILVLSCLNGRVAAVAFQKGVVAGRWDCAEAIEDFANFGEIVKRAIEGTRFAGSEVMVALAHPQLTVQLEEVPSAKGRAQDAYLERRIARSQNPGEEVLWSQQPALQTKNASAVILHVCPVKIINAIVAGCESQKLGLTRIIPVTSVLARLLARLGLGKEEVGMLAAELAGTTTVVVGGASGGVHLARMMPQTWAAGGERLVMDINRTALFAKQQCGTAVDSIWLYGGGGEEEIVSLQGRFTLPVKPCPVAYDQFGLTQMAAEVPRRHDGNLIPPAQRLAPARRFRRTVVVTAVGVFSLISLLAAAYTRFLGWEKVLPVQELQRKADALQVTRDDWEKRHATYTQQEEVGKALESSRLPPTPAWFFAYLADVLPPDLFVTKLEVKWQEPAWTVRLGGYPCVTTNLSPLETLAQQVSSLSNLLASEPFRLRLETCRYGTTNAPVHAPAVSEKSLWLGAQAVVEKVLPISAGVPVYFFNVEGATR